MEKIVRRPSFLFATGIVIGIAVTVITLTINYLSGGRIFQLLISNPTTLFSILIVLLAFVVSMFVRKQIARKQEASKRVAMRQRRAEEKAKQRLARLPEIQRELEQAEEVVKNPDIRRLLCPALLSATNDAFECSKIITPILAGAIIANTIALPPSALLFAAISIVVARSGVSAVCANYTVKK